VEEIEAQFAISKSFFGLSKETKGKTPHSTKTNNGWEYKVSSISLLKPTHLLRISGSIEAKYWDIRSKGISLVATSFRMAK